VSTVQVSTGCQKSLFQRVPDCLRPSRIAPLPPTALATTPIAAADAGLSASHTGRIHEVSGGDASDVGAGLAVANVPMSKFLPHAGVSVLIPGAAEQETICKLALRSMCILRGLNDVSTKACRLFASRSPAADLVRYLLLWFPWVCASGTGVLKLIRLRPCLMTHGLGRCSVNLHEAPQSSLDLQSALCSVVKSLSFTAPQRCCNAATCQSCDPCQALLSY